MEGAEPSSPSAEGEIPRSAFLFASFFFAPTVAKEKAAKVFVQSDKLYVFGLQSPTACNRKRSFPFTRPLEFR